MEMKIHGKNCDCCIPMAHFKHPFTPRLASLRRKLMKKWLMDIPGITERRYHQIDNFWNEYSWFQSRESWSTWQLVEDLVFQPYYGRKVSADILFKIFAKIQKEKETLRSECPKALEEAERVSQRVMKRYPIDEDGNCVII